MFSAEVDLSTGDVCYVLDVKKIGAVNAAHIHKGLAGKDGKPVTPVDVTGPDDDLCIAMEPDKLKEIVAAPGAYYVNVHTADFPAGAIRGQFEGPTGESAAPAADATGDEGAPVDAPDGDDAGSGESAAPAADASTDDDAPGDAGSGEGESPAEDAAE
jgi:hypothetical protein